MIDARCRRRRGFAVVAAAGGGKRITQQDFTDKAWQAIIAAPDTAKQVLHSHPLPFRFACLLHQIEALDGWSVHRLAQSFSPVPDDP